VPKIACLLQGFHILPLQLILKIMKNYAGSENIPYIDRGKGPSIAKALHDPSTTETETREINGDQEDD